jgi:hypothetical protein
MIKMWHDHDRDIHIRISEIEILQRRKIPPKGIPTTGLTEGDIWVDPDMNLWVVLNGTWRAMTLGAYKP